MIMVKVPYKYMPYLSKNILQFRLHYSLYPINLKFISFPKVNRFKISGSKS
jgi:hypothetical protein